MISKDLFEEKFFKMITLCGFTFVSKNADDYLNHLNTQTKEPYC